jgi:Phage Mu protein F like protein
MSDTNPNQLPFSEAIEYFSEKIGIDTDSWTEGQGLVQQVAFTVAGAKGSLLQEIRESVDAAINDGTSIADFAKQFDRIADSYVDNWQLKGDRAWRGQLIYDQNLRQAYGAGRYRQMTEPETVKRRPYWQWRHGDSRVPRPTHLEMDGKVFPADSLSCHVPAGFGCRCQIFSLSQRDVDREGLAVEDVKFEADPGFNYKPGKQPRSELLKRLDPDIRRLVLGESESEFARMPEGKTKVVDGKTYILKDSRWRKIDAEEKPVAMPKLRPHERNELVIELSENFKQAFDRSSSASAEANYAVSKKLIDGLMALHDRADANASADRIAFVDVSQKDRAKLKSMMVDFFQITGATDLGIKTMRTDTDRSHCHVFFGRVAINMESSDLCQRYDVFHEMGHFTEHGDPDTNKLANDFVRKRATGEKELLSKLTGEAGYGQEKAYPDKFFNPYVGKTYDNTSTEVQSMGLQMFSNPHLLSTLYQKDPDHFDLMIRYLRSGKKTR